MKAVIGKGCAGGAVAAPPSKSYTIRALFAAALAEGRSVIRNPLAADDSEAAADVLTRLGAGIERGANTWTVAGGNLEPPHQKLDCRQSAATLRFLAPVCAALEGVSRITFAPGLARRPMAPLFEAFSQLGVASELAGNYFTVHGTGGRFKSNAVSLPGNVSSQFVSGLLLAAPLAEAGLEIRLTSPAESKDYLCMTLDCLRCFGIEVTPGAELTGFRVSRQQYRPAEYTVEGDWSSASYFLGLGALAGRVNVSGLSEASLQADRFILRCLRRMGAAISTDCETITVSRARLKAIDVDLNEAIDLLPTVACLAAAAEGTSVITGLGRARLKESDRISAVTENLKRTGIAVVEGTDCMTITGGLPHGAVVDSCDDHRVAMAFAMLGAACGDMVILGAECVNKTYPGFWEDFRKAGGKVDLQIK
ncbi:3-phosphoshikimate 1-carboxyvinyltransferase [Dehalogenimonas alkenigignens]|uniref:3-phosphoshikimate 1-carboxyvinyltransferase n=1 Tax=Dehalogenimonas alkenigignens TaxID=1217799 RepID=A0A0W0GG09_9CHLR|nr:3-phosphoshikimate 1-carboxyvinyltransferase [Dehalogenimonas alkenigignens]KTB47496.1 3-phosphoshikimate 1-carboxyvinyltransferase [Dehalogenimonas alkenigignens]PVV83445.1 3-phosphoshikimate 1-carboxyvinyltransferase [Dehalogenimonas alkenigignens]